MKFIKTTNFEEQYPIEGAIQGEDPSSVQDGLDGDFEYSECSVLVDRSEGIAYFLVEKHGKKIWFPIGGALDDVN